MWSSRLFWKLFAFHAVVILVTAVTFTMIVSGWQKELVLDQVTNRLRDSAVLLRREFLDDVSRGRAGALQEHILQLGRELGIRITWIDMNGHVLADSMQPDLAHVAKMENHKDRLELVVAAARGHGSSQRRSPTINEPMFYYALRADQEGAAVGLVRTALPMTQINQQVAAIQRLIWFVGLLVGLGAIVATYFVAARLVQPIRHITNAAEAIATGDYEHPVYVTNNDEIGAMARSFNKMRDQLAVRESQLRESSRRLATVLGGMVEGVIAVDDRDRIMLANSAAGRLLGFSATAAEGRPLLQTVRNHALYQAVVDARGRRGPGLVEIALENADKRVIAVNSTLLPGEPSTRVILVLYDVTELRRLESLSQEFVANVSHELKTPLSSIKAYAETLSQGAIHDQQNNLRFVHRIEEQADRLHQLILDLLSLSRIESGQQTFDIAAVKVSDVAQLCLAEHQTAADAKGIRLTTDESSPDVVVRIDEEGLKEILTNLIDNAVKYTPDGGQVTVRWRADGRYAILQVHDTGIGIAAEHLPRVFERFYRVDKARSRELGGTGLGLSIVKHLAQVFGGSAEVASDPGKGTVFTVRLPLADQTIVRSGS
jgi:two-component system phosphate regulon sensor histidine kinase PhoR